MNIIKHLMNPYTFKLEPVVSIAAQEVTKFKINKSINIDYYS